MTVLLSQALALLPALVPAGAGGERRPPHLGVIPDDAILYRVQGGRAGDWFGYAVCGVGDLDGDGVSDFAVGAHQNWSSGPSAAEVRSGYVCLYSGADGSLLRRLHSCDPVWPNTKDGHFGVSLTALEDVDGDGAREIVVGSYLHDTEKMNCGAVFVFSGLSQEPARILRGENPGDRLGFDLAVLPDRDGDGSPELLLGSPKEDRFVFNGGSLCVVSSRTLETLERVDGNSYDGALSFSLDVLGDLDGDEVADFAGGAPYADVDEWYPPDGVASIHPETVDGHDDEGLVVAYSGVSGEPFLCLRGARPKGHLGWSVAALGDVDGDGCPDLAAGAIQSGFVGDFTGPGYVRAWSGRDGRLLYETCGEALGDQFGWSLCNVGDVDGDGRADLLVGAPAAISVGVVPLGKPGRLELRSGADGALIRAALGREVDDQFGTSAALLGDLDGDGLNEVIVGAPENVPGQTRAGYALVLSGRWLFGPASRGPRR